MKFSAQDLEQAKTWEEKSVETLVHPGPGSEYKQAESKIAGAPCFSKFFFCGIPLLQPGRLKQVK